jgi:acetyltransferase-like isoleucine patch superfamily enzyme
MMGRLVKYLIRSAVSFSYRTGINSAFEYVREQNERCQTEALLKSFGSIGRNPQIPKPYRIVNPQYMHIGDDFSALYHLRLEAYDEFLGTRYSPKITMGNNVRFNTDCHIGCIDQIVIGNDVLFASRVFITDHFHGSTERPESETPVAYRRLTSKGPVVIGDNVWIGEGVAIMPGVTIGRNCIIGANAVIHKSFPDNCVIAGVPARIIRRFSVEAEGFPDES